MTTADTKRIEKIARESAYFARKSLQKSNELEAYLSVLEYRAGKFRRHKSVRDLFRKLKVARGRFSRPADLRNGRLPSSTSVI